MMLKVPYPPNGKLTRNLSKFTRNLSKFGRNLSKFTRNLSKFTRWGSPRVDFGRVPLWFEVKRRPSDSRSRETSNPENAEISKFRAPRRRRHHPEDKFDAAQPPGCRTSRTS
jgi:hypothetical protein